MVSPLRLVYTYDRKQKHRHRKKYMRTGATRAQVQAISYPEPSQTSYWSCSTTQGSRYEIEVQATSILILALVLAPTHMHVLFPVLMFMLIFASYV